MSEPCTTEDRTLSGPGDPEVELLVCETCAPVHRDVYGEPGGARLYAHLIEEHALAPDPRIRLRSVRCLWSCRRACNLCLRSRGRAGYVLCELEPGEHAARAVLAYASLYADSTDGNVPFRSWPAGVRGHFLCRTPPDIDSEDPT